MFWEPWASFWTPLGPHGAHVDRKTALRKMIEKRVARVAPGNPVRGGGGPTSPDKWGGPALRTLNPTSLGVVRDDRALEALHFVPQGHGGG